MKNIIIIIIFISICFLHCKTFGANKNKAVTSPNIIIMLVDDLGWGDLACYGNPIIKTPNLDRLANSGIRFTQFHSAGAICSPSRAALLTGKSPYRLGFYQLSGKTIHLKSEEITIPELLKQKQYATFFAGKWHISDLSKGRTPDVHGFDYYLTGGLNHSGETSTTRNPTFVRNGQQDEKTDGYSCDLIVDEATHKREFGNLLSIKDNYRKLVVSMDKYVDGSVYKGVEHWGIRNFLLKFE